MSRILQVAASLAAALLLFAALAPASAQDASQPPTKVRDYYIAAEEVDWDFAPLGRDETMGLPLNEDQRIFYDGGPGRIGHVYHMARYIAYKDPEWKVRDTSADPANGIMGPVLHAEVGERIVVHFLNRTTIPTSVHPHGVFYAKDSEGSMTNDGSGESNVEDDAVPPNHYHTYVWDVPERAGPGPSDASSVVWLYHSHVDEVRDTNTGLFGVMVITAKGMADAEGKPKDVDREAFTFFGVLDQSQNLFLPGMMRKLAHPPHGPKDEDDFKEANKKHTMNGYIYGNGPMQTIKLGERVRWYVYSLGTEVDLHTPHWHGNTVLVRGHREDVVELLPASTIVADMTTDNPGVWMYHCHVNDHIAAGMMARYEVLDSNGKSVADFSKPASMHGIPMEKHEHAAHGEHGHDGHNGMHMRMGGPGHKHRSHHHHHHPR